MAVSFKNARAEAIAATQVTIHTGVASTETYIKKLGVLNYGGVDATVDIWRVQNGETLGNEHRLEQNVVLNPDKSFEKLDIILQAGDFLVFESDVANVNANIEYIEKS